MTSWLAIINAFLEDTGIIAVLAYLLSRGAHLSLKSLHSPSRSQIVLNGTILGVVGLTEFVFPGARYPYVVDTLAITFAAIEGGIATCLVSGCVLMLGAMLIGGMPGLETAVVSVIASVLTAGPIRGIGRTRHQPYRCLIAGAAAQMAALFLNRAMAAHVPFHLQLPADLVTVPINGLGVLMLRLILQDAQTRAESERNHMDAMLAKAEAARQAEIAVLQERHRIAGDVHDTLAQVFTGIQLQVGVAQRILKSKPEAAGMLLENVGTIAREGLADARRTVWMLQSRAGRHSDLAGSLTDVMRQKSEQSDVKIELSVTGESRLLPAEVGWELFHIGQEALVNSLRHAGSKRIAVEIAYDSEQVSLAVRDDGRGFDAGKPQVGKRYGLIGMRRRAERIGAQLAVVSGLGKGTEVAVTATCSASESLEKQ